MVMVHIDLLAEIGGMNLFEIASILTRGLSPLGENSRVVAPSPFRYIQICIYKLASHVFQDHALFEYSLLNH